MLNQWQALIEDARHKVAPRWRRSNPPTYNGYDLSVIKSGLQKEARRGNGLNMLRLAIEADASFVGVPKAKANMTNVINRLLLITSEDIALASPKLPVKVLELYEQWRALTEKIYAASDFINIEAWIERCSILEQWIQLVANQPKLRMISDLAAVYIKPYKVAYAYKWHPELFEAWDKDSEAYAHLVQRSQLKDKASRFGSWMSHSLDTISKTYKIDKSVPLLHHIERLFVYVETKNDLAFKVLKDCFIEQDIISDPKNMTVHWRNKKRHKDAKVFLIWNLMVEYCEWRMFSEYKEEILALSKIYDYRKDNAEAWVFLVHGLSYLVWKDNIRPVMSCPPEPMTRDELFVMYNGVLRNDLVRIYPYFLDKHTHAGKKRYGTGRVATARFALEGAQVCNEQTSMCKKRYRTLYVAGSLNYQPLKKRVKTTTKNGKEQTKMVEEAAIDMDVKPLEAFCEFQTPIDDSNVAPEETDAFTHQLRAQLLTGKNRPGVFYACTTSKDSLSQWFAHPKPVVYKGPFLPEQIISLRSAVYMMHIAAYYKGILPIACTVVHLYPTPVCNMPERMQNPEGFGARCKVEFNELYPFLVMEDIARPFTMKQYPHQLRSSKCWPETMVADTKDSLGAVPKWTDPTFSSDANPESLDAIAQTNYIVATLFSYIWQVTDTCDRNFVWIKSTGQVYRVDTEDFHHPAQLKNIYKKPLPTKSKSLYLRALSRNWKKISQVLDAWKALGKVQPRWVRHNIDNINSVQKIEQLL